MARHLAGPGPVIAGLPPAQPGAAIEAAAVIPSLPTAQIHAAIEADDWSLASLLLGTHQREVTQALATVDPATVAREPWQALVQAQRALLEELRVARDGVGAALGQFGHDRRGARAWLRELA